MGIKFSNNASANIIQALSSTATSVSVTEGKGDLFPSLTEGDYFYATLAGNNGLEIVKVTNRIKDAMTIVRAQDNTVALSFDAGDLFELRIVAADFNDTFSEVNSALNSRAPTSHASSSSTYGAGSSTQYGHLKSHDNSNATYTAAGGHALSPAGGALILNEVSKCLKLTGGTMSGAIVANVTDIIASKASNSSLRVHGGTELNDGASLILYGKDSPNMNGRVQLCARNGNAAENNDLVIGPNGYCALNGNTVITSAGGTLNGVLVRNGFLAQNSVDNNTLVVRGGTDSTSAFSILYGKNHSSMPGVAGLVASKDSQSAGLYVYPDGHATLSGSTLLTSAGGNVSKLVSTVEVAHTRNIENSRLWLSGGTNYNGGSLILYGSEHADYPNEARLKAGNTQLRILPDGTGRLADKPLLTVVAEAGGDNWYKKYSNGWIVQGGTMTVSSTMFTVNFNTPFTTAPKFGVVWIKSTHGSLSNCATKTASSMEGFFNINGTFDIEWIACGF